MYMKRSFVHGYMYDDQGENCICIVMYLLVEKFSVLKNVMRKELAIGSRFHFKMFFVMNANMNFNTVERSCTCTQTS